MKPIEQIAEEKYSSSTAYGHAYNAMQKKLRKGFLSGFTYAKEHPELLRELFEEFAEWMYKTDYSDLIPTDGKMLADIWFKSRNK